MAIDTLSILFLATQGATALAALVWLFRMGTVPEEQKHHHHEHPERPSAPPAQPAPVLPAPDNGEVIRLQEALASSQKKHAESLAEVQALKEEVRIAHDAQQRAKDTADKESKQRQAEAMRKQEEDMDKMRLENLQLKNELAKKKEKEEKAAKAVEEVNTPKTCSSVPHIPYELPVESQKEKKIGEIMVEHNFIVKDILDKALDYQVQHGGTITQYLLAYGYIDEGQLAKCLCSQFKIPYLPLASCEIPERVIKSLPVDLATKYLAVPIDRAGDSLMVVMADPLDPKALKAISEATGCELKTFVGILSEITQALEQYYHVNLKVGSPAGAGSSLPFLVESPNFRGMERRESIRFRCALNIRLAIQGVYKQTVTKDVSRDGFCFDSESAPPMGSVLSVELYLPQNFAALPMIAIGQVVRIIQMENNKYEIGVKMIKIAKEDLAAIINYAASQKCP